MTTSNERPPRVRRGRSIVGLAAGGMVYNQAVTVLSGVLIGRIVGAADYGIANIAKNLFQIAAIVTPLGLDLALQRYFAGEADNAHRHAVLSRLRLLTFVIGLLPVLVLAAGLGPWLGAHVYRYRDFAGVIIVSFAALPFATDAAVTGGAYRGLRRPAPAVFATFVLMPTARVAIAVALFVAGWRLWAIVVATSGAQLLSWLYVFMRARRDFARSRGATGGAWGSARGVLGYSWAMGVSLVVTMAAKSVDVLVLGHFRPSLEVGRYVAVQLLVQMLAVFSAALGQTLGSSVAERFQVGDIAAIERLLVENMRRIALVAAPLYAIILFWGDRIDLVLGPSFVVEWRVVVLLATNQMLFALFAYTGYGLSMTGKHKLEAALLACGLAATLVLCLILVPRLGAVGAAIGTLVALSGVSIAQFTFSRRFLGVKLFRLSLAVPFLLSLGIATGVRFAMQQIDPRSFLSTAVSAIAVIVLYGAVAFGALLSRDERDRVLAILPLKRFRG